MKPNVTIYTDGGCEPNPGTGAWAAVLVAGTHAKELSGVLLDSTNNRAELTAAIEGLKALKLPCVVTVISDSRYVVDGASGRWNVSTNLDLWAQLRDASETHEITYEWVRGHTGNAHNERCHDLVTKTLRSQPRQRRVEREVQP